MTPKQYWVAAYRFERTMQHICINGASKKTKNGLYPSWMPDYKTFLSWCITAKEVMSHKQDKLKTQDKRNQADKVKRLGSALEWNEMIDDEYIKRKISDGLRDLYHAW